MWEHAKMLESQAGISRRAYAEQRGRVEAAFGLPERPPKRAGECKLPWRSFFRNDKLAYYQQGVNWLRDAFDAVDDDASRTALAQAAVCLGKAFREWQGGESTCGERTSGGWTEVTRRFSPKP